MEGNSQIIMQASKSCLASFTNHFSNDLSIDPPKMDYWSHLMKETIPIPWTKFLLLSSLSTQVPFMFKIHVHVENIKLHIMYQNYLCYRSRGPRLCACCCIPWPALVEHVGNPWDRPLILYSSLLPSTRDQHSSGSYCSTRNGNKPVGHINKLTMKWWGTLCGIIIGLKSLTKIIFLVTWQKVPLLGGLTVLLKKEPCRAMQHSKGFSEIRAYFVNHSMSPLWSS